MEIYYLRGFWIFHYVVSIIVFQYILDLTNAVMFSCRPAYQYAQQYSHTEPSDIATLAPNLDFLLAYFRYVLKISLECC